MKLNPSMINEYVVPEKEAIMLWDKYDAGYFFSEDK